MYTTLYCHRSWLGRPDWKPEVSWSRCEILVSILIWPIPLWKFIYQTTWYLTVNDTLCSHHQCTVCLLLFYDCSRNPAETLLGVNGGYSHRVPAALTPAIYTQRRGRNGRFREVGHEQCANVASDTHHCGIHPKKRVQLGDNALGKLLYLRVLL